MKLLIITQAVDLDNPVLGFFHSWIEAFAAHRESIEVVCLFEGRHELPPNVHVHSLGKEHTKWLVISGEWLAVRIFARMFFAVRFLRIIISLRKEYDAVFVHMNPEYVLLGGLFWKLMNKPVCLWRNHYQKHWMVDVAGRLCKKVFSTSKYSYAASLPNAALMPVGVDIKRFPFVGGEERKEGSILFLARMSPSKRPHLLLDALALLQEQGVPCTATFVGDPLPKDAAYHASLRERAGAHGARHISFLQSVPNRETPGLYQTHDIFVNASPSGMFDKTMFEAMASGALVVAANKDLANLIDPRFIFEEDSASALAERLLWVLALSPEEKQNFRKKHRVIAEAHSLGVLMPQVLSVIRERSLNAGRATS